MDAAASFIAVIQLTGALVKLCGGYIQEVKNARDEILTLQRAISGLHDTLQDLQKLPQCKDGKALPTSSRLASNIADCLSDLQALEAKLDPGKGKMMMRKVGLRAFKWPLKRTEVESIMQNLERYKSSFLLSLQVDQTSLIVEVARDKDLQKLEGAMDAGFGSFSDRDEVQCFQGTRTDLLHQIMTWTKSPSQKGIFWLKGMAGTGKSTISRTVARSLKDNDLLGASFFFKRGEGERGTAKKFFPTLTRQLVLRFPELWPSVRKALHDDPDVGSKSLGEQFDKLLLQPLVNFDRLDQQPQTAVIVIDALDECDHNRDIQTIIQLLPLLQKAQALRFRIFVTSRPEPPINLEFAQIAGHEYQDLALHEIPEEVTEHDIRLFLQGRFAKIKHDKIISQDWPGDGVIQELVMMSVPLFISAATVCRYIETSKLEPKSRLAELLKDQAKYVSRMDKTYLPILMQLLDDQEGDDTEQQQVLQEFQDIIGVIILLAVPLSTNSLSLLLGIEADQISNRLDSFHSVLSIPDDRNQPVRILHLSFREFLVRHKTKFFVDEPKKHKDIAKLCLKTMRNHLQKNICNLPSPGTHTTDIPSQLISQRLPLGLQYSCHYWIHHFQQSQPLPFEIEDVLLFLQKHFLHWVEAMSLLGLASQVVSMLDLLKMVISDDHDPAMAEFLYDAKRFVLKNHQIAEAPLQLYCAGLIFAPKTSIIRRKFEPELPTWIWQLPWVEESWGIQLQALEGHSDSVRSVAFSPDGRLLASGSDDTTVRLWNPATGALQRTLNGHRGGVIFVVFSPDGHLLASVSTKTLKLWDPMTGTLQQTFEHESIWSVAFSPDSRLLASTHGNDTVRLWDLMTGSLKHTFAGAKYGPQSVAFSPDGRLLAFVSGDQPRQVQLWELATGALQQTLESASVRIYALAFSPDGNLLATGGDCLTQLWDLATGTPQEDLAKDHEDFVWSLAFSSDGRLLASGTADCTVKLRDPVTGGLQQTLEDPLGAASVAISPNGQLLASGSDGKVVQLRDLTMYQPRETLEGHKTKVTSLAFSPSGQLLASGGADDKLLLWDPVTGALHRTLEFSRGGWVKSLAFSSDEKLLACGSLGSGDPLDVLDLETGAVRKTFMNPSGLITSLAFSPDGSLLASGSSQHEVCIRELGTGTVQRTFLEHKYMVTSVAFSPDGRFLASGSTDRTIKLWDTATGTLQQDWTMEKTPTQLEFAESGSHLFSNAGVIHIQHERGSPKPDSFQETLGIIVEDKRWVKWNGEKILWLDHPGPNYWVVKGNILALGFLSGRVSFIGFRGCQPRSGPKS